MTEAYDTDKPECAATVVAGTGTQPQRFVVYVGDDTDAAQASGQWVSAEQVAEVKR
jgi:hypothetical protein